MRLLADIGGTNIRLALLPEGSLAPQDEELRMMAVRQLLADGRLVDARRELGVGEVRGVGEME